MGLPRAPYGWVGASALGILHEAIDSFEVGETVKRISRTSGLVEEVCRHYIAITKGIVVGSKQAAVNVHCQSQCLSCSEIFGAISYVAKPFFEIFFYFFFQDNHHQKLQRVYIVWVRHAFHPSIPLR